MSTDFELIRKGILESIILPEDILIDYSVSREITEAGRNAAAENAQLMKSEKEFWPEILEGEEHDEYEKRVREIFDVQTEVDVWERFDCTWKQKNGAREFLVTQFSKRDFQDKVEERRFDHYVEIPPQTFIYYPSDQHFLPSEYSIEDMWSHSGVLWQNYLKRCIGYDLSELLDFRDEPNIEERDNFVWLRGRIHEVTPPGTEGVIWTDVVMKLDPAGFRPFRIEIWSNNQGMENRPGALLKFDYDKIDQTVFPISIEGKYAANRFVDCDTSRDEVGELSKFEVNKIQCSDLKEIRKPTSIGDFEE